MPSLLRSIAVALAAVAWFAGPAFADKRVALVIGNGAYQHTARLPNPKNDAEDVSAALRPTGFETIVGLDLDKAGMEDATIRFVRAAREADVAIFYYSGHALQFNGINYLMPVDARLNDEADLRRLARVDEIVSDVQLAKNLRILVLDSCRDNPLAEQLKRRIGTTRGAGVARGLAKIDSPQGMILAFSTQAGSTADDGTGRNSPYTAAFLKHIEASEEIGTVFRRVSADVFEATKRAQLPELSLSLIGEFYLKGRPASPLQAAPPIAPDVAALQEELKTLRNQINKKSEPQVGAVAPPGATERDPNSATAADLSGEPPQLIYTDWSKVCPSELQTNGKKICVTSRYGLLESGAMALAAALFETESESKKWFRVQVPSGMSLAPGTRLIIDQSQPMMAPFGACAADLCYADYEATPEVLGRLRKGQQATIQAFTFDSKLVSLTLPLAGFAKSLDGKAMDQAVYVDQQTKFLAELRRRAQEFKQRSGR